MQRSASQSAISDHRMTMPFDHTPIFTATLPANMSDLNLGYQYPQNQIHPAAGHVVYQSLIPIGFDSTEAYYPLSGYQSPDFSQTSSLPPVPDMVDDMSATAMSRSSSTSSSISTDTNLSFDEGDMTAQHWTPVGFDGLESAFIPDLQVSNPGPYIMPQSSDFELPFDLPSKYHPLPHFRSDQALQRLPNTTTQPRKPSIVYTPPTPPHQSRQRQPSTRKANNYPSTRPSPTRSSAVRTKNFRRQHQAHPPSSVSRTVTKDTKMALPRQMQSSTSRKSNSSKSKIQCDDCDERFRGPHELDRHRQNKHSDRRIMWICIDGSSIPGVAREMLKVPLDKCRHCLTRKPYGAYYNGAAQ
jgi:hypothetical protein